MNDMNDNDIDRKEFDVVVIGGGAAGLSAALVLSRARRSVAVVDAGAPRNSPAAHMQGFLSRDGMPPGDLLAAGRDEVQGYGGHLIAGTVAKVDRGTGPGLRVLLASGGQLTARRIVLATGLRDELPDVPGVRERWARDLLHCPYCHGYEVRDQQLGVLGGTPDAVQHALLVRQWSSDVIFFPNTDTLTADDREQLIACGIGIVEGPVARLVVDDDHLRAGIRCVSCDPNARHAGAAGLIDLHPACVIDRASHTDQEIGIRDETWADENRCAVNDRAIDEFDPAEVVIVHDQPGDRALDDADAAGDELLPVVCGERVGVREEDDVGRPLAHQQGMLDGVGCSAQHSELLVADLVSVAVGAMQEISRPTLADAGDVGQVVSQPRGDDQPPGGHLMAVGKNDPKPWSGAPFDGGYRAGDQVSSVALHLVASHSQQITRWHACL